MNEMGGPWIKQSKMGVPWIIPTLPQETQQNDKILLESGEHLAIGKEVGGFAKDLNRVGEVAFQRTMSIHVESTVDIEVNEQA